ncbi:hypothetical protein M2397_002739 [Pseudomonas sp. BIGb0381]|uniref:hypothetical protein n=1 Tax=Pseudomonas sp. BIGb0381 TaxID=2940608 RepID=UPI0021684B12|nr:hypothetical protein [Pseudomonas sp. BIGb0381]MCS4312436.1 hypothetical protein [Pseudomonas sp. BIGb0381]
MPNVLSKLPDIIGAWIGLAIGLFLMTLFLLPAFLFGWIMWGWASPAAIYSFIYDKTFMIVIGAAFMLLLIWTEGFKASLDDAPALAKFQYETPNPGWLWRYYLGRNRDLIEAYWRVYNFEVTEDSLAVYLQQQMPKVYRRHTQAMSFFPEWLLLRRVNGHIRSSHVRHTRNGPVNVRSHHVSDHTRSRRR